jgi:protein O-mannosyl-transferase
MESGAEMNMQRYPVNRIALAAAAICLLVFLRALACDFVGLDDGDYILKNTDIRHLDARLLVAAFTRLFAGDYWMPLTWLSFALDYRFWGLNPLGYHLTNILLHAANAGLVVLVADRLCRGRFGGSGAFVYPGMLLLAGLLFGIHPLRVESVAWATERKDVLNGLFALGSILCYLDYARAREGGGGSGTARRRYLLSLVLFVLSLMAKPVSVVIPALLLVADWYPLGRLRKGRILPVLAEKLPFFVGSGAMAAAIILIMSGQNSIASGTDLSFGLRVIVSGNAVFEYVRLQLFPVGILPFYVLAKAIPPAFAVKTAAVAGFTCLCIYAGRRRPWVCATWLSFVIPLLPVLAFFYNGIDIAFAARFTYLPAVVPSIVAAALCAVAYERAARSGRRAAHVAAMVMVAGLLFFYGATTWRLIGVWRSSGTLWTRVIEQQPLGRAYQERGLFNLGTGRYPEAVEDLSTALAIAARLGMPENYNILAHRGEALRLAGRHDEAVRDFSAAIALNPHPVYFHLRGLARKALGDAAGAAEDLVRAGVEAGPLGWY